jgi:hypothetical protein
MIINGDVDVSPGTLITGNPQLANGKTVGTEESAVFAHSAIKNHAEKMSPRGGAIVEEEGVINIGGRTSLLEHTVSALPSTLTLVWSF